MEFVSAPFWSIVSTRFRQAKNILLMALLSWIVFTVAIGLINPPPHSCWREMNATHQSIERVGYKTTTLSSTIKTHTKRSPAAFPLVSTKTTKQTLDTIDQGKKLISNQTDSLKKDILNSTVTRLTTSSSTTVKRVKTNRTTTTTTTTRPSKINSGVNDDDSDEDDEDDDIENNKEDDSIKENRKTVTQSNKKQSVANDIIHISSPKKVIGNPLSITATNLSLVKPLASPVLYEQKDVRNVFMVFLLLIIIGEFFSAPAITLAVKLIFFLLNDIFIGFFFRIYVGCLYIHMLSSRYSTIWSTANVRKFRLGFSNIYCCYDIR